jgi:hypothetical protein
MPFAYMCIHKWLLCMEVITLCYYSVFTSFLHFSYQSQWLSSTFGDLSWFEGSFPGKSWKKVSIVWQYYCLSCHNMWTTNWSLCFQPLEILMWLHRYYCALSLWTLPFLCSNQPIISYLYVWCSFGNSAGNAERCNFCHHWEPSMVIT